MCEGGEAGKWVVSGRYVREVKEGWERCGTTREWRERGEDVRERVGGGLLGSRHGHRG